jgi:quercetin dioxygenase-like cupin family protein
MSRPRAFVRHEPSVSDAVWEVSAEDPGCRWRTLTSGDRTPSDRLTTGVLEVEPGGCLRPHWHPPPEVYHVIAGQGVVTVDGAPHTVESGATIFIPANALHGIENKSGELFRIFYAFPVDAFPEVEYHYPADGG